MIMIWYDTDTGQRPSTGSLKDWKTSPERSLVALDLGRSRSSPYLSQDSLLTLHSSPVHLEVWSLSGIWVRSPKTMQPSYLTPSLNLWRPDFYISPAEGFLWGFPGDASGKESSCQHRRHKRCGFDSLMGKIPWRRIWQPTIVFLPGESPWTEEPDKLQFTGSLQSMGSQRGGRD